ncbi:MAG: hypothetical protein H6916_12420 [Novosphingobium sp.]|uniref:hypothetical protein n=1 Tax=Novosphingobium sp. TaxID=1874826 RepID=UPI0026060D18|nr:hypothetical protein [Novosphingobium sp.]MCP5387598.1 hypothetical protein [Novosphingobium sp.]
MNLTRDRARSIGWAAVLLTCFALLVALTFRVNAVKSQVRLTERRIVAIKQQNLFLETEFETRANQQQLRNLNDVEFGYSAPTAGQYLENERQLAALGKARGPDAPSPIRVASAQGSGPQGLGFPAMVSPLTGKPETAVSAEPGHKPVTAATLGERLGKVDAGEGRKP